MHSDQFNVTGDVSGSDITITQIYAPGSRGVQPQYLPRLEGLEPFSPAWLLFSQEAVEFIGRTEEREAIHRFLESPKVFTWWLISGDGGTGKSRLALQMLHDLPNGWKGCFLAPEHLTLTAAAATRLEQNTLWIIDDAASLGTALQPILSVWATLYNGGTHKLRLLLLERGHSNSVGWFANLTQELSQQSHIAKQTLYRVPLCLSPLGDLYESFLHRLLEQVDAEERERLRVALDNLGPKKILEYSQYGNPLLLMLLVAELTNKDTIKDTTEVGSASIAELYFSRELRLLKARCDDAQLRFGVMLELMFLTTSCFPLNLPLENDKLVVLTPMGKTLLVRDLNGLYRIPSVGELGKAGLDVEAHRLPILEKIAEILEVDDVESYLAILNESGLQKQRYALRPDLIAAVLFNLIFNSSEVSANLKRQRGEFSAASLCRLVEGAQSLARENALSSWARLSDRTLARLIVSTRDGGRTIRWPLLLARALNSMRSAKVPFNIDQVFSPRGKHTDARAVGGYFAQLRTSIVGNQIEDATARKLASSPHCWVAPYVEFLFELSVREKMHIGLVVTNISQPRVLSRLTNVLNFLVCLRAALTAALPSKHDVLVDVAEIRTLDRLVDGILNFVAKNAWPAITAADDRSFKELYTVIARLIIHATFIIANQKRGRTETKDTRRQALEVLTTARWALSIAPSTDDLQFVDRNSAILTSLDLFDPVEIGLCYSEMLQAMATYADADSFTNALEDLFYFINEKSMPCLLETLISVLIATPRSLVRAEVIIGPTVDILGRVGEGSPGLSPEQTMQLTMQFFRYFSEQLRKTEDVDSASGISSLVGLMCNMALGRALQDQVAELLVEAYASLSESRPSAVFLRALIHGIHGAKLNFLMRDIEVASLLPFDTTFSKLSKEQLKPLVRGDGEAALLERIDELTIASTFSLLSVEPVAHLSPMILLGTTQVQGDLDAIQSFTETLIQRIIALLDGNLGATDLAVPPSEQQ